MRDIDAQLPDPTLPAVALWLKSIDRAYLHERGWAQANQRFHGLALAARPFINRHFDDPDLQEAAFDGLALALITLAHFSDIEQLADLFEADGEAATPQPKSAPAT